MNQEDNNEVSFILPENIQEIVYRRSTRDPQSRFARKLHVLLSYVSGNPELEEEIGLGWVSDTIFQICKMKLLKVMKIKLNTLNVNLKIGKFLQLHCDKPGWTRWKRDGFSKRECIMDSSIPSSNENNEIELEEWKQDSAQPSQTTDIHIGKLAPELVETVYQQALKEWIEVLGSDFTDKIDTSFFIPQIAKRYCAPKQPYQNAFEVLLAIFAPQDTSYVRFIDFYKFYAFFGPSETIMLKIASLLEVATSGTHWMYFGLVPNNVSIYGHIDDNESNCLVIHGPNNTVTKIWNNPTKNSNENYIIDQNDQEYESWVQYFQIHPILDNNIFIEHGIEGFH